jgi:hypothetical protein
VRVPLQHDRARQFAILRGSYFFPYRSKLFLISVRGQDVAIVPGQPRENLGHLRWSFPLTEDHFGHAHAQGTMMIDFGKTQVFEGEVAQTIYSVVGHEFAVADLFEKFADGFGVHGNNRIS